VDEATQWLAITTASFVVTPFLLVLLIIVGCLLTHQVNTLIALQKQALEEKNVCSDVYTQEG